MKKLIFEILSVLENWFIRRNIISLKNSDLMVIGGQNSTHYFCLSGSILPTGGSGTALKLASAIMKVNPKYGVILEISGISRIDEIKDLFPYAQVATLTPSEFANLTIELIVYTNWQSYYKFNFINSRKRIMFVQDGEYWFFPVGGIYYLAIAPYRDASVEKICLGSWLKTELREMRGKVQSIPFPTTFVPTRPVASANIGGAINVLVYIKHSFRRAGGVLLNQLRCSQSKLDGTNVVYTVIGYKPSIFFKMLYPAHIRFLGYVSEQRMQHEIENCDIGAVFSCTNVSLFPFQLAAFRKPVIELDGGGASIDQLHDVPILVPMEGTSVESAVRTFIGNSEFYLNKYNNIAIKHYSMEDIAAEFVACVEPECLLF
jgi:hypothetical protein